MRRDREPPVSTATVICPSLFIVAVRIPGFFLPWSTALRFTLNQRTLGSETAVAGRIRSCAQRLNAPDSGEKDMKENSCPRLSLLQWHAESSLSADLFFSVTLDPR